MKRSISSILNNKSKKMRYNDELSSIREVDVTTIEGGIDLDRLDLFRLGIQSLEMTTNSRSKTTVTCINDKQLVTIHTTSNPMKSYTMLSLLKNDDCYSGILKYGEHRVRYHSYFIDNHVINIVHNDEDDYYAIDVDADRAVEFNLFRIDLTDEELNPQMIEAIKRFKMACDLDDLVL